MHPKIIAEAEYIWSSELVGFRKECVQKCVEFLKEAHFKGLHSEETEAVYEAYKKFSQKLKEPNLRYQLISNL